MRGAIADWNAALAVNLGGRVNGCTIVVPILEVQGEGAHIANTA